jgi:hypothetical protein
MIRMYVNPPFTRYFQRMCHAEEAVRRGQVRLFELRLRDLDVRVGMSVVEE